MKGRKRRSKGGNKNDNEKIDGKGILRHVGSNTPGMLRILWNNHLHTTLHRILTDFMDSRTYICRGGRDPVHNPIAKEAEASNMRKTVILAAAISLLLMVAAFTPLASAESYTWDGVNFVEGNYGQSAIRYPHPNRDAYAISPYVTWSMDGIKLIHNQFDRAESMLLIGSATAICSVAGAAIGARMGGAHAAIVGAILGAALGLYITYISEAFLDEHSCIWWWVSIELIGQLSTWAPIIALYSTTNPSMALAIVLSLLSLYGYIRVGPITFLDALNIGSPAPPPPPPSGGGCPTLFVWNGTDYAEEGILDIHAESDVTLQHEIQNTLALDEGVYKLQLRELDNFTSHIDQVRLYAVDDKGEWHSCPLTYAYHNELGNVKGKLRSDDDVRVDLKPTEIISVKFAQPLPYSKTAYFIFEINGYNRKPLMK